MSHGSFFTSLNFQQSSTGWFSRFPLLWTSSSSMRRSSFGQGSGKTVLSLLRITSLLLLYLSQWAWLACGHSRFSSRVSPMWPSGPVLFCKCPYLWWVLYSYSQGVVRGDTRGGFGKSLSHIYFTPCLTDLFWRGIGFLGGAERWGHLQLSAWSRCAYGTIPETGLTAIASFIRLAAYWWSGARPSWIFWCIPSSSNMLRNSRDVRSKSKRCETRTVVM